MNRSNPFSTRFVRPGAIAYRFDCPDALQQIARQWALYKHRGAIVGPHGSGKTTLLATLLPQFEHIGWQICRVTLHDGQRAMPRGWNLVNSGRQLVVIDGFEQLSHFSRWNVHFTCWLRGWGLLVTAHRRVALPTLFETSSSVASLQAICRQLLGDDVTTITPDHVADALARSSGDVREALFDLYDRYDRLLRQASAENPRLSSAVEQLQPVSSKR